MLRLLTTIGWTLCLVVVCWYTTLSLFHEYNVILCRPCNHHAMHPSFSETSTVFFRIGDGPLADGTWLSVPMTFPYSMPERKFTQYWSGWLLVVCFASSQKTVIPSYPRSALFIHLGTPDWKCSSFFFSENKHETVSFRHNTQTLQEFAKELQLWPFCTGYNPQKVPSIPAQTLFFSPSFVEYLFECSR